MSKLNYVAERNRVYVRSFDHEEAKRRYEAGERVVDLAGEYGVSAAMVYLAINPASKRKRVEYARGWRTAECEVCGGPAMRADVGTKRATSQDGRTLCFRCRAGERRERLRFDDAGTLVAVRCSHLDCVNGERWQPPENFGRGERHREIRDGGIHGSCRSCLTRSKRRYRAAHPEYNARQNAARRSRRSA